LENFSPDKRVYEDIKLAIGIKELPVITWETMDKYQTVSLSEGGLNGISRITVTAGDGSVRVYQLQFSVQQSDNCSLKMIYVGGVPVEGFDPEKTDYSWIVDKDAAALPELTWEQGDTLQKVTPRKPAGKTGDYRLTVRAESGATRTYVIHFDMFLSSNTSLAGIRIDGVDMDGFRSDVHEYVIPLSSSKLPSVEGVPAEASQKLLVLFDGDKANIRVTAESGDRSVYTVVFDIQKSQSAFLRMIYLDGDSLDVFDKERLIYSVPLQTATCPLVTVDKEENQQVAITMPYAAGDAQILVHSESGEENLYVVTFTAAADLSVQLDGILIDGTPLEGFAPATLEYTCICGSASPVVTPVTKEGQQTVVLSHDNVVTIYVTSSSSSASYSVTLQHSLSSDCTLAAILADGQKLQDFVPEKKDYRVSLPAGSALPELSYLLKENGQTAVFGQSAANEMQIIVTAQDGVSRSVYNVTFEVALYDDADLENLMVEGRELDFKPATYDYELSLESGVAMPALTVVPKAGQTTMSVDVSDSHRQVVVTAESGRTNTYNIRFARETSANALLADILIDGVSLKGFEPAKYSYVDTLEQDVRVVPAVWPVGQHLNQTITTYFSGVDGVTRINVVSEDGSQSQDYFIAFPTRKSSNNKLEIVDIENVLFDFNPDVTDYEIELPASATAVPSLVYEKAEEVQKVRLVSRPLGQTTQIIVTAENGDTRTYSLTFVREQSAEANRLQMIRIVETDMELNMKDRQQREFEVQLPYGTRTMSVEYEKMFPEQTVFVAAGGVNAPTYLTVRSNRAGEADEVYKIVPNVSTDNPAVITSLTVNGEPLAGFSPYNYSYIVPVEDKHIVRYVLNKGAEINVLEQNEKHWQAEVTYGSVSSVYDLWFYYKNDVLPNPEFDQWENAQYKGVKPVGWNTLGQFTAGATVSIVGTYTTGNEVVKDGSSVVKMTTSYNSFPLGGYVPAYITLGTINASFSVAAGSDFSVSGGITFRNSPDRLSVNFKQTEISNSKSRIVYQMNGSLSSQEFVYTNTATQSSYTTVNLDLRDVNSAAGLPQSMNIILNSFESESGKNGLEASSATMYVDWARFSFNHTLTGLTVDDIPAALSDKEFAVTLADAEKTELPVLKFTGEVADQAQTVTWQAETPEGAYGVRRAAVRNFAENGTDYTDYTLVVKRPLDTRNTLKDILVNGLTVTGFDSETNDYVVHLPSSAVRLPDFACVPQSSRQSLQTTLADSTVTVVVTPEYGEARTYTVRFVTDLSSSTELAFISSVADFSPEKREYTVVADVLPDLKFTKKTDGQTVDMNNGVFTVTAEDGTQGTYTVALQRPSLTTSGQLKSIELDNIQLSGFSSDVYDYTKDKPLVASFARMDMADSVVFVQKPAGLEWRMYGYDNALSPVYKHTYTLQYAADKSDNTDLQGIYIDGKLISGFATSETDYVLATDTAVSLTVLPVEPSQSLTVSYADNTYTILVKAESGATKTYKLALVPDLSSDALLASITLDGVQLPDFAPDKFSYHVILPVSDFKTAEPVMPLLEYTTAHPGQTVEVQLGRLGETTNIIVSAEDGVTTQMYEVLVEAEPSHNALLTGIVVNGALIDRFESGRHYYSVWSRSDDITIDWTSEDRFQTYRVDTVGTEYTVTVTAQDRIHEQKYVVEVFVEALPNDATLRNIMLDSLSLDRFDTIRNPRLTFDPNNNKYLVNLPAGTEVFPVVSAQLKMDGQQVELRHGDRVDSLFVTAKDGRTVNVYTLEFIVPLSSNTDLSMIYLGDEPLSGFAPDNHFYPVVLPVGVHVLPEVLGKPAETVQKVDEAQVSGRQVTVWVHAEDGSSAAYTILFSYTLSENDKLAMIYADDAPLSDFQSDKFNYYINLPVGTNRFPELSYDSMDIWQTVKMRLVREMEDTQIRQIEVEAESGAKNTYTVSFTILKSAVDTLRMINIDNKGLGNFNPYVMEYSDTLAAGTERLPLVEWELGDRYQTVTMDTLVDVLATTKSLGQKIHINVHAQNNTTRTYIVHFPIRLSSDTLLSMIMSNGRPLPGGFNKELQEYEVLVPYNESGEHVMPAITVEKSEEAQNVDIVPYGDSLMVIRVMAEDAVHFSKYYVRFRYGQSPVASLAGLFVNGEPFSGFHPDSTEFGMKAYVSDTLPLVEWIPLMEEQLLYVDGPIENMSADSIRTVTWICDVTAPDMEHFRSYMFSVEFSLTAADTMAVSSRLKSLSVRGLPVSVTNGFNLDFCPDSTDYVFNAYPRHSDNDVFFAPQDIRYQTEDPLARVDTMIWNKEIPTDTFRILDDSTVILRQIERVITLVVSDRNGQNPVQYALRQSIQLSHDSAVVMILVNGKPFIDFDPDIHEYTYYIKDGATPPDVSFVVSDSAAYAPDVIADEYMVDSAVVRTRTMVCMSEYAALYDKSNPAFKNTYTISFVVSGINEAQKPLDGDVLVRHLPYSTQVMLASLRSGVQVGLYDHTGKIVFYRSLEAADPANVVTAQDAYGREIFTDVRDVSRCVVVTLKPNQPYFYVFFEAGKKKIVSGKLVIVQ